MIHRGYHIEQFGETWVISSLRRIPLCEASSLEEAIAIIDNAYSIDAHTRASEAASRNS